MALQYSIVAAEKVGPNRLNKVKHRNTLSDWFHFKYTGYPRVYRDMKKSYKEGNMRI